MQENKPVLELKNTEEKVYQVLKWKKNICQCALIDNARVIETENTREDETYDTR